MFKIIFFIQSLFSVLLEDRKVWRKEDIDYLVIIISAQVLFPEKDSKYFTDLPLKYSLDHTLAAFDEIKPLLGLKNITNYEMKYFNDITKETVLSLLNLKKDFSKTLEIKKIMNLKGFNRTERKLIRNLRELINKRKILKEFMKHHFLKIGKDIEPNVDERYFVENSDLTYLSNVTNETILSLAYDINETWRNLSKVKVENVISSLEEVKYPFFIPGGRFREFYYWDNYWALQGILISKMDLAAENLIRNFIEILKVKKFIPNGSRGYYSRRTQPPFFCSMLEKLYEYSSKFSHLVLNEGLEAAEKEFKFFEKRRRINVNFAGKTYKMFLYKASMNTPRVESFKEDFENWFNSSPQAKRDIFMKFKASAESGIDFTSRTFKIPSDIKTIDILNRIPVDLNALMYKNAIILSNLFEKANNHKKAKIYKKKAEIIKNNINELLWIPEKVMWADFIIDTEEHVSHVYFSNFYPMLFKIVPPNTTHENILKTHKKYFFENNGGIPAGEEIEGVNEQWDFPNVWAPYNQMMIEFLLESGYKKKALLLARKFFKSVLLGFQKEGLFFEKYDSLNVGKSGDGGEYEPQSGFCWTNSTVIYLIDKFGDKLIKSNKQKRKV